MSRTPHPGTTHVSSDLSLTRIRRHVLSRPCAGRSSSEAALHRGRTLPGHSAPALPPRQGGPQFRAGLCGPRAQGARQARHDLPHLFDDQADHQRSLHDAVRGRPRRARRARPQIYPGVEESRRVRRRHCASLSHQAFVAPDADRRSVAPHLGPDLRLPAALQRGRRLPRQEDRGKRDAAKHGRGTRLHPTRIFARRSLELFGFHRRDRLLIGKISGRPFEQFLQERILDPLGMNDTGFFVAADKASRFAACYSADPPGRVTLHATERKSTLTLQDDPAKSPFLAKPSFVSGGGGLCSTAADYLTFCRALIHGGELGGVRLLGPKTLKLMTTNHLPGGVDLPALSRSLFSEATYNGMGFGLGFAVNLDPAKTLIPGSAGEYNWGGLATTSFWIDPAEELIAIFMTQVMPSTAYPVRRELRTMVYTAITDSNLQ